ncbi:MAG TPA: radical SAM protein [Steroidobacteraceae bacterium]|nr:radical SAM protein [Steroidobacteraceae bacterium]
MLSVLVAHSYFLEFDQKQRDRAKPYPPLATLQVAAMLREAGHRVSVFDAMLASGTDQYAEQLGSEQPQVALFYEDNFNFLTKMCLGRMREAACEMIARARLSGARVIVAGSDASDAPDAYLAAGAHVVLIGEGLATLRAIIDRLHANPHLPATELATGLAGVATPGTDRKIGHGRQAPLPPEPSHPERPAWDLVEIEKYRAVWHRGHGFFSLNMAASRGCSFRCNWCAKPIWGSQYLQRSPSAVAAEMTYLKRAFHPDHVWFADDIFGFRVDWVQAFAAAVRETDGSIPFTIQSRADLLGSRMVRALGDARCIEVWIGAESGSQRVLDAMNKGIRVEDIREARERLKAENIRVCYFIQLGYLDEQLDDILATRELIESTQPDDIGVSVAYPLPGTKFYETVKQQLRTKSHWEDSDDLEMMFEGTYSSDFYRAVRNLLHEQVGIAAMHRPQRSHDQREAARRDLQRRWCRLLSREEEYRLGSQAMRGVI